MSFYDKFQSKQLWYDVFVEFKVYLFRGNYDDKSKKISLENGVRLNVTKLDDPKIESEFNMFQKCVFIKLSNYSYFYSFYSTNISINSPCDSIQNETLGSVLS